MLRDFWAGSNQIGVFEGMSVVECPEMPWDSMAIDTLHHALLVGEIGHLRWVLLVAQTRIEIRRIFEDALTDLRQDLCIE